MSVIEKIKLNSDIDGLKIGVTIIAPTENIKGIVQISHGMAEHRQRYEGFMKFLADNGYVSIINDHRGHGESIKEKEDLGYFYEDGKNAVVEDLYQVTKYIKERFKDLPLHLFSHSMGTLVSRSYIKKYDFELSSLILCGPPSKNSMAGLAKNIVKILTKVKGNNRHRSKLIDNLVTAGNNNKFEEKRTKNDWLCSVNSEVDKYEADESCGYIFTLNGFDTLFDLIIESYDKNNWAKNNKDLKIFLIAGEDDPVIKSKKAFYYTKRFLQDIGYSNVKEKLYQGKRHEILNEDIKEEVYKDVLDFINNI